MKLHVNRTCFHDGLKSQTGISSFCLSCERTLKENEHTVWGEGGGAWDTHEFQYIQIQYHFSLITNLFSCNSEKRSLTIHYKELGDFQTYLPL